ncbi:hypothetical protein SFRURICE_004378 [Spodoptera frugiperda]|uniref:SFRICE_011148 n=1 Tax=Spodoptera frugiperda TaxID=7108 RepID=A0A2H1VZK0_SPOFR|nr:uncharacterized protein LOC126910717 isoform X1 [Spodoptera frugiperda]KAF9796419.1 hypothetical protein SFRURICE_004378 [Spodoptera frugiperda]
MTTVTPSYSKYKISRRGRKLQVSDDARTLVALPKDIPERTWAEILQKEENDLIIFDIREEILDTALKIGYENYMEKQTAIFTVHCATEAWLKLIDWHFYRHDPGEDSSAYPPCYIPHREDSWIPDKLPDPSPKDTWGRQELNIIEDTPDAPLRKWPSSSSLDLPVIEEIPEQYWFPGKVQVSDSVRGIKPDGKRERRSRGDSYVSSSDTQATSEEYLNTESEVLQKVTDYSTEGISEKDSSYGELKTTTPVDGSLHGAGDSTVERPKRRLTEKSKSFMKPGSRSKATLPPLEIGDSRSRISIISDCRLRNLRLETQFEVTSEKVDTPPGEVVRKK